MDYIIFWSEFVHVCSLVCLCVCKLNDLSMEMGEVGKLLALK